MCSVSSSGWAETFEETKALVEQGDAGAQYRLGLEYSIGESIEKDFDKALAWFHKAASWSSPRCTSSLCRGLRRLLRGFGELSFVVTTAEDKETQYPV